ncbi:hypothetical protein G3A49_10900 [Haloferax volcanii]|uniref:Uncharacterized protein n=3 Tax=Haloferax volcanii TaxID=2246 RepID=A0A6C0UXU3_HALVO|nr:MULTISPECIES: hypothetical protein [Haloferax]ELZ60824.1 hypothetical protein C460_03409 [Haloferax sp. ATCC BAA-646]ELZ65069.1 hypothetical protein C459_06410 [Haloferax sp. ATCC BAA-645]ELZ70022.1 hypothetical protein C458_07079 [Haloferax sp. ATCC BAA-644]ELZ74542.1 hypothetical protein C456_09243 [Haloferax lucentense DSM 14919]ELZ93818.1 hypothetical protein C452_03052 [Haloferax alexandrinus JCM 10717]
MSGIPSTNDSIALDFASTVGRLAYAPLETVAFWSAVALPLAYLPVLSGGLSTGELPLFAGLIALHAVALVLGRDHGQQ